MKPVHTANTYTIKPGEETFTMLREAYSRVGMRMLDKYLQNDSRVVDSVVDRDKSEIRFSIPAESREIMEGKIEGVTAMIEDHVRMCENVLMFVPKNERNDGTQVSLLCAHDRYVYTSVYKDPFNPLGVALNFLEDGVPQRKWFVDDAAEQIKEIIARQQWDKLDRLTGKHIDLEEPNVGLRM